MTEPLRLNLGCGKHPMEGWVNIDNVGCEHADRQIDLDRMDKLWLPWDDDTVDEVYSSHMIEHLHRPLDLMQELWRVCKADARATFLCPYGSSDDADENPTHVRRMFVGSWGFFGQPNYWREDYGYRGDWVVEEVHLRVKREVWADHERLLENYPMTSLWERIQCERNVVSEQVAILRCNKPARPADRELQENKVIVIEVLEPINAWENAVREVGRLEMGTRPAS